MSNAATNALREGDTLSDRYKLVRPIGQGGMGSVWEVVHARFSRQFALKVMSDNLMSDSQALARFRREADLVASLRHPNIIEIVDMVDLDNGVPCIVMEYLEGEDLSDRISRVGALDWPTVAMVGEQMLQALSVAHAKGIIHRDLKPRNIFMAQDPTGRDYSKLLDFGLSKSLEVDSLTMSTTTGIGTPAYMAPEQADERMGKVGPTADIWAMGVVLFEMATGRLPFMGESPIATLYQICHGEPADLRQLRPDAPDAFIEVIDRALQRKPEDRWSSVDEMREALSSVFGHLSESSKSSRRLLSSPSNSGVPTPPPADDEERKQAALLDTVLETPRPGELKAVVVPESLTDAPAAPAASKSKFPLLIAAVLVAASAAAGIVLMGGEKDETSTSPAPAAAPAIDEPAADETAPPPGNETAGNETAEDQRAADETAPAGGAELDGNTAPATASEAKSAAEKRSEETAGKPGSTEASTTDAEPKSDRRGSKRQGTRSGKRSGKSSGSSSTKQHQRERGKPINPF